MAGHGSVAGLPAGLLTTEPVATLGVARERQRLGQPPVAGDHQ